MFMEKTAHLLKIAAGEPFGSSIDAAAAKAYKRRSRVQDWIKELNNDLAAAKQELAALTPPAETANSGKLLNKLKAWGGANKKALMIGGGVAAGLGALGGGYALGRRSQRNR